MRRVECKDLDHFVERREFGCQLGGFGRGDRPADHVTAEDVEHCVQVIPDTAQRVPQLGDVPGVHLAGGVDDRLGLDLWRVGGLPASLAAAEILNESGISVTVVNCRYLKPHDERVLAEVVSDHRSILVVEEGTVVNGFGARMSAVIAAIDSGVRVVTHGVPDNFVDQAPRAKQLASLGLDARGIAQRATGAFALESARGTHLRAV